MDTSKLKLRAEKCIKTNNFKLAQVNYQQVLEADQQDLDSRKNLRAVNTKLFESNNKKVPSLKVAHLNIKIGMAGKNHSKVLNLTEKLLGYDPNNIKMLIKQGLAALELDYKNTAIYCFESAHHVEAKNIEPLKLLMRVYEDLGGRENLKKAVEYGQILREVAPGNKEVQDLCKNVDTKLAQLPFSNNSFEDGMRDKSESDARERDEQIIHSDEDAIRAIQRLKEKSKEDPNNPNHFEKMGDLLLRLKKYEEAKKYYNQSLSINSANTSVMIKLGDIDINRLIFEIVQLKEKIENGQNDEETLKKLKSMESKRHVISVRELEKRVKSQPTVNSFKFELGKLYFAEKRDDEAIRLLQISSKEPKYRTESLILLGKLFSRKGDYELAISEFDEALQAMVGFSNQKKDTLYSKADALESLNKNDLAKAAFQSIMVEDIGYRDVSKRVDKLKEKLS